MKKKIPIMNPEYEKIVDEIIAEKLSPQEALIEIFEKTLNVKFIDTNEKSNK